MRSASHSVLFLHPTVEVVSSAAWTILAPVSWCWPSLASAIEITSPRDLRPLRTTPGYFIVRRLPMLQSIHLISAASCARPRLVTRLNTLDDQFWTVMYWIFAPLSATSSTTALWSVAVENLGAVQPSM